LPVEEGYYPLLLFSSGKKRREFLRGIAEKIRMYGAQTFLKHLTPEEVIQNLDNEALL